MQVHAGQIWGKRQTTGDIVAYRVLKVGQRGRLTLQNLRAPVSVFDTDAGKLDEAGYFLLSRTPYVDLTGPRRKATSHLRPVRCPRTVDMFEGRADGELPDLTVRAC
jgi:hypothetical protein